MASIDQLQQLNTWSEILSQPGVWTTVLAEIEQDAQFRNILDISSIQKECLFIGCGTSFYLAEAAARSWSLLSGRPARAIPASDVLLYPKLVESEGGGAFAMVISRSGKTSEALRAAAALKRDLHLRTAGITCAERSELAQICDETIVLRAADEKSTVMTRSFTSMLITLQALAARHAGNLEFIESLRATAGKFGPRIHRLSEQIEHFVATHSFADYVFLGQGPFHGIAREAALKVMEMSCSYSQFFHALEFRHGPKAIVSPATCLTFFLSNSGYQAEAEVLEEMKALGGSTIAICSRADADLHKSCDLLIELNLDVNELALLAPYIVPCQLFGLFTGIRKGLNPDLPKNLSRVVILD